MSKLTIGDKVKVNASGYGLISELHRMEGTVVRFSTFLSGTPNVGVDFGIEHELFHDLHGNLSGDTGRYFGHYQLERVEDCE